MANSRYRKIKVGSIRRKKIIILLITISLLFISGGYSILNSELGFSGTLIVNQYNSNDAIRVANVELIDKKNNGNEINKPNYSSDRTNMNVSLPNTNSSVTYRVTVTNKNNNYFTLESISTINNSNSNIRYSVNGVNEHDIYHNNTITFDITFTTTSANQSGSVTIKFDFQIIETTVWTFDYAGGEQSFKAPYNATYKLEVWGASGGDTLSDNRGGYGGYSVGNISFNVDQKIFINVGGSGVFPESIGFFDGGYNGGAIGSLRDVNGTAAVWGGSGGGATHIAKVSGVLTDIGYNNRNNILIVAGGGGGGETYTSNNINDYSGNGGSGGGYIGGNGVPDNTRVYGYGTGGTQSAGGAWKKITSDNGGNTASFGLGAQVVTYTGAGGGGGFFGGGTLEHGPAGGGSGYIDNSLLTNKSMYCFDCSESTVTGTYTISTTGTSSLRDTLNCSQGFSNSAVSKCAKKGNGYAKISLVLD